MLLLIGWILLGGYLLNEGHTTLGSIVLISLFVCIIWAAISGNSEREKARANKQYYWAQYYDKDQVEARKRMQRPEPVPDLDDEDDWIIIASAFDDD